MIQSYLFEFPEGHSDGIGHIKKFMLTDIGECEVQVFPYQDDENPPTVYIVKDNTHIICGIRLDAPLLFGVHRNLTDEQKKDIDDVMRSIVPSRFPNSKIDVWYFTCAYWSGMNDRLDRITFPESQPDYTKLP